MKRDKNDAPASVPTTAKLTVDHSVTLSASGYSRITFKDLESFMAAARELDISPDAKVNARSSDAFLAPYQSISVKRTEQP